ncbi:hypothetical protein HU200_044501 [Digitaria exilis]|uniref:Galactose oxidase-like Early set domain-containing protein n=1 Tax=Digitaria exilis TaxID=1010633 RepID=A0A835AYG9_9POAL|nr:hypothetical protein HU200_044501 [Digitaria exilis]
MARITPSYAPVLYPHAYYNFKQRAVFSPEYLDPNRPTEQIIFDLDPCNDMLRPRITTGAAARQRVSPTGQDEAQRQRRGGLGEVSVTMVVPSFTMHSSAMNQRLLFLDMNRITALRGRAGKYHVSVTMPLTVVLPPPAELSPNEEGVWVHIQ